MRELSYAVEGKVANLRTFVLDEPGHGGACHRYRITGEEKDRAFELAEIKFQNGPINEGAGINGVQHEDLLAIIIDRLTGFQAGAYACDDNAKALAHCKAALKTMQDRTRTRIARNVEGTHQK